jgi:hypothetical protein
MAFSPCLPRLQNTLKGTSKFKTQKLLDTICTILIALFVSLSFFTSLHADEHNDTKAFASVRFFTDNGDLDLGDTKISIITLSNR